MSAINCWPEGYSSRFSCEETIPDDSYETMKRFGWGWVWASDPGAESGRGPFLACPEHRGDCSEEEREAFRQRYADAKAAPQ